MGFIKTSRDLILKRGAFQAFATLSESSTGEGSNREVTGLDYDAAYYVDGKRKDLIAAMQAAADWCESQLMTIEAQVPAIEFTDDDEDLLDLSAFEEEEAFPKD